MKASIIIPTLNEVEHIENTINQWLNQTYKDIEIIVVDGSSTDRTCEIVAEMSKKHPNVSLVVEPKTGPAEARNIGCRNATGDIVVLIDADIATLNDKFLEIGMHHFEDTDVIGVCPRGEHTMDTLIEDAVYFEQLSDETPVLLSTYPLLLRRSTFLELGGFPCIGYGEDKILRDKVLELIMTTSKKIRYENNMVLTIHGPHTLKEFWNQQKWYGRTYPLYAKSMGLELPSYVYFYLNVILAYSLFFILAVPIFPVLAITLIPFFSILLRYLLMGIRSSNFSVSMTIFILLIIGGFAKGFGLLEYLLKQKQSGQ